MEVRIGLIGAGWMGKAHTVAYRNVPLVFGPEPAICMLDGWTFTCRRPPVSSRTAAHNASRNFWRWLEGGWEWT